MVSEAYGEDDFSRLGGDEDGYEEEEDENSKQSVSKSVPKSRAAQSAICQKLSDLYQQCSISCLISSPPLLFSLVSVEETGLDITSSI